ncbi:MAG: isopropylmalate isomerase, partial [Akkermansiaceae bacterium]
NSLGHPIDAARFEGASVMLVGPNFGCGSSREHAPQSIYRCGFRAIIGVSFAEIFFGNSTGLGMPCVCATVEQIEKLATAVQANPALDVAIDLQVMQVSYGDETFPVTMPAPAREALLSGRWDPIQELLDNSNAISNTASSLSYIK